LTAGKEQRNKEIWRKKMICPNCGNEAVTLSNGDIVCNNSQCFMITLHNPEVNCQATASGFADHTFLNPLEIANPPSPGGDIQELKERERVWDEIYFYGDLNG